LKTTLPPQLDKKPCYEEFKSDSVLLAGLIIYSGVSPSNVKTWIVARYMNLHKNFIIILSLTIVASLSIVPKTLRIHNVFKSFVGPRKSATSKVYEDKV
jgi:hypothetical protein